MHFVTIGDSEDSGSSDTDTSCETGLRVDDNVGVPAAAVAPADTVTPADSSLPRHLSNTSRGNDCCRVRYGSALYDAANSTAAAPQSDYDSVVQASNGGLNSQHVGNYELTPYFLKSLPWSSDVCQRQTTDSRMCLSCC